MTLFAASRGTSAGWRPAAVYVLLLAGVALLVTSAGPQAGATNPHSGSTSCAAASRSSPSGCRSSRRGRVGAVFLMPVFTQAVQDHRALATGWPSSPRHRHGDPHGARAAAVQLDQLRNLVALGFAVLALTSAALLPLTPTTPLWVTAAILSGRAAATGLGTTPLLSRCSSRSGRELADGNTVLPSPSGWAGPWRRPPRGLAARGTRTPGGTAGLPPGGRGPRRRSPPSRPRCPAASPPATLTRRPPPGHRRRVRRARRQAPPWSPRRSSRALRPPQLGAQRQVPRQRHQERPDEHARARREPTTAPCAPTSASLPARSHRSPP